MKDYVSIISIDNDDLEFEVDLETVFVCPEYISFDCSLYYGLNFTIDSIKCYIDPNSHNKIFARFYYKYIKGSGNKQFLLTPKSIIVKKLTLADNLCVEIETDNQEFSIDFFENLKNNINDAIQNELDKINSEFYFYDIDELERFISKHNLQNTD